LRSRFRELNFKRLPPKAIAQPFRPFYQKRSIRESIIQAKLLELLRSFQPVQIDMQNRDPDGWGRIRYDQRKTRARRLVRKTKAGQDTSREARLSCPKVAE
jgi:hypothetical protein